MKKWYLLLAICFIIVIVIIAAVARFAPSGEEYFLTFQHQWNTPPMTSTTANFIITGRQWYVEWAILSYSLISCSMNISVRDVSTNALVGQATLTNDQRRAYFDRKGTFYLSIALNNATEVGQQLILVNIWELRTI